MPAEVRLTVLAQRQASALRGAAARSFEMFLDEFARSGCAALGYRLTGDDPLARLCVRHLRGALRVVVAFEDNQHAWVLLVGPHADHDPLRDVYATLYRLAGTRPPDDARRTKPPCCGDDGAAPSLASEIDDLVARARSLTKR